MNTLQIIDPFFYEPSLNNFSSNEIIPTKNIVTCTN